MELITSNKAVHVEVCMKLMPGFSDHWQYQGQMQAKVEAPLKELLARKRFPFNKVIELLADEQDQEVLKYVESILLECECKKFEEMSWPQDVENFGFHYYWPKRHPMEYDTLGDEASVGDILSSCTHWLLPNRAFVGGFYEEDSKENLLKFALSALLFSQHKVNANIISCNRLILLHGPKGSCKTSLCKALAQKLSIRCRTMFPQMHLIEINSHSLFSKWFSESGKLVMHLFTKIKEIIAVPNNLVCVLIDEVESLAYARDCMSGQEPKDAMRLVNVLLTQLDIIKEHPNVLILATSNSAETIDLAFLDRADIKQYIGLPNELAIRKIYESRIMELKLINDSTTLEADDKHEGLFRELTRLSKGLSGRTLRMLPIVAHAMLTFHRGFDGKATINLADFLDSMFEALKFNKLQQMFQ